MRETTARPYLATILVTAASLGVAAAADVGMFGNSPSRNMVSDATGLPASWDPESGENIKWKQALGSQSYGGPVLAGNIIYVGTNNENPRNADVKGDKGVMMAFRTSDGQFLWQIVHDKLAAGRVNDWPLQGICSGPYVEADRLYYVSNRAEVVCAKTSGDIVWSRDMIGDLDVFPHNLAAGNPLVVGNILFTVTGNGVDEGHVNIPAPRAPSFLALDKNSGETVWSSDLPANNILHGQWSNPSYGVIGGVPQVVFPGGDGWLYGMVPETGEVLWKFDANPKDSVWELGGAGTRNNIIGTPVIYEDRVYIGVGQDPEHGEAPGNFWVIDATGRGDITSSHVVWHRGGEDFGRTISTAAIADGLVYISDLSGFLYCLDAGTGEHYWTYDAFAAIWGSAFVADGKVYLGDEDGDVAVLKHGKQLEVLEEINMGASVYTTPIAENGVLYIASRNMLWAISGSE
jgi:outer membrane protein assembly factor BamB